MSRKIFDSSETISATKSYSKSLQTINPTSQIPNNFHKKLGKIELLTTFCIEMVSAQTFYGLFIIARGSY